MRSIFWFNIQTSIFFFQLFDKTNFQKLNLQIYFKNEAELSYPCWAFNRPSHVIKHSLEDSFNVIFLPNRKFYIFALENFRHISFTIWVTSRWFWSSFSTLVNEMKSHHCYDLVWKIHFLKKLATQGSISPTLYGFFVWKFHWKLFCAWRIG